MERRDTSLLFLWRAKTTVRTETAGELGGMWSELVPE